MRPARERAGRPCPRTALILRDLRASCETSPIAPPAPRQPPRQPGRTATGAGSAPERSQTPPRAVIHTPWRPAAPLRNRPGLHPSAAPGIAS